MENSQEKVETENIASVSDVSPLKGIQFEDIIDINDIQKKLNLEEDDFASVEQKLHEIMVDVKNTPVKKIVHDKNIKKYVIYIDSENVDYMESLSVDERKNVINGILKDKNSKDIVARESARIRKYVFHVILACMAFIIFFPLIFSLINNATEISIANYKIAKQNFSKLYRNDGKVQYKK